MGAMTTMGELAKLWSEMIAEERVDYRVRFNDEVFEVISIELVEDQAMVRGYQLNGPMADNQRDDNSRTARVKMIPLRTGGIEILDRDDPIDRDDPGPPPTIEPVADDLPALTDFTNDDYYLTPGTDVRRLPDEPADLGGGGGVQLGGGSGTASYIPSTVIWTGDPTTWTANPTTFTTTAKPNVLDTPVDTWASTAIRMPHELLDRAAKEAKRRGIGRNQLLAYFVDQGLRGIEGKPVVGN